MSKLLCVGCKKPIKNGEFVTLNGGAMIKTRTGAMMGDHRHIGFLTVNNHFDSKKSYQTMVIADNCKNGQFEFYACSHKCLASFISKGILNLEKLMNIKKIEIAPQKKVKGLGQDWCQKVVSILGFRGALVTDESRVYDFFEFGSKGNKCLNRFNKNFKKYGIVLKEDDLIYSVAEKLKKEGVNIDA